MGTFNPMMSFLFLCLLVPMPENWTHKNFKTRWWMSTWKTTRHCKSWAAWKKSMFIVVYFLTKRYNRYKNRIGFFSLKVHLETLLNKMYSEQIKPVMIKLEELIASRNVVMAQCTKEIKEIESENTEEMINSLINHYISNCKNV